jgi:hypothetical protein
MSTAGGGTHDDDDDHRPPPTTPPPFPPPPSPPGPPSPLPPGLVTHAGACHCGAVRFEADAPPVLPVVQCNCSRCSVIGGPFAIVPAARFRLVAAGAEDRPRITAYTFNTRAAVHTFCAACGVQAFYRPRSNPDCVSVLVPALDPCTVAGTEASTFDGRNWEAAYAGAGPPKPAGT